MRLASGPRAALASLIVRRGKLWWRGLDFVERAEGGVAADALLRVDTCWSVVTGLAMVDNIRAADFQTRHLILALETGEPSRVARALAAEAVFRASDKSGDLEGTGSFAERARLLSERIAHPHSIALSVLTSGMGALLEGRWRKATGLCSRALQILRDECVGTTWEVNLAQNFLLGSLLFRGELRQVACSCRACRANARARRLYFETELRTRMNLRLVGCRRSPTRGSGRRTKRWNASRTGASTGSTTATRWRVLNGALSRRGRSGVGANHPELVSMERISLPVGS